MPRFRIAAMAKRMGAALAASLALISVSVVAAAPTAEAAVTEGFEVSNLLVKKEATNPDGTGGGRTFSFDWSTQELGRAPKPGEGFEIQSPHWMHFSDGFAKKPMMVGDKEIGTCLIEHTLISCTVDERITDLDANQTVAGSFATGIVFFFISGRASEQGYYSPYISFSFNDKPVLVAIPEGREDIRTKSIDAVKLSHDGFESGQDFLAWHLDFIPTELAALDAQAFSVPDGKTSINYDMTAIIDERFDMENFQKVPWELREISRTGPKAFGPVSTLVRSDGSPNNGFSIDITGSGAEKGITLTGPFKPDAKYRLYLPTKFGAGTVPVGEYPFTLKFNNGALEQTETVQIYDWMVKTAGFETVKVWGTSSTDHGIPPNPHAAITGELTYDLPGDTKASDYPDWKNRPKEIADDDGQGTIAVKYGHSFTPSNLGNYPVGTTLSFVPGDPGWNFVRIDPEKTTVSPESLTVTEGTQNRFIVTYAVTGATKYFYGTSTLAGEKEAVDAVRGKPIMVDYTCTENGATAETGTLEIPGGRRSSGWIRALPGAECVMKVKPESLSLPEGFAVDPEQSELEKTIVVANDLKEANIKLHFIKSAEKPAVAPAEANSTPDHTEDFTSEEGSSAADSEPPAPMPTDEPNAEEEVVLPAE